MNSDFLIVSIEDDESVAKGLILTLESSGYQVLHFSEGDSFFHKLPDLSPSLLLLDIRLPGKDGFQICRELRERGEHFPVIMLTARDDDLDKIRGLEDGADDYIVKPYSRGELLSRINARLRRSYGVLSNTGSREDYTFGPYSLSREGMSLKKEGREVELTPIEYKLLLFFLKNEGQTFGRKELLNSVWSSESTHYGDERTVDVHIRHLRTKIEESPSRPVYLKTVRGVGYCFDRS
ncbi:MAG: response regulator transcription factor [Spirochaetales bacterium]|nr:response regulator transcription factor [Spirochaetales bacterium]